MINSNQNNQKLIFENKRNLFGEEKLAKTIELEDLSEDDKKSMATGAVQILPQRDSSGRAVVIALDAFHLRCYVTNENPERNVVSSPIVFSNAIFIDCTNSPKLIHLNICPFNSYDIGGT